MEGCMKKRKILGVSAIALCAAVMLFSCTKSNDEKTKHNTKKLNIIEEGVPDQQDRIDRYFDNLSEEDKKILDDPERLEQLVIEENQRYIEKLAIEENERYKAKLEAEKKAEESNNQNYEHCENENFDNQVAFCNDILGILTDENVDYQYFESDEEAYGYYDEHHMEAFGLFYLNKNTSVEDIVTELNNLYILSQAPSCLPEDWWNFFFKDLIKNSKTNSLYDEYIDMADFVHEGALLKDKNLVLEK